DVLPGVRAWPASANEEKARFEQEAVGRRAEIVARLNRAESGALRGRVYEGDGVTFEFVDRTRVFVKSPLGQTLAGTYTEERDGRIVVTLNNESMVLSREGRRYRARVCAALEVMRVVRLDGRLEVRVTVCPPDNRRRDLDNVQKALLDALAKGGAYRDDSQIDRLVVERGPVTPGGKVLVAIEPIVHPGSETDHEH
ncbi:MAG: RusA family crossover junction endodeoxyribonuclease, partial [Phycisphaerales bacterium]